MRKKKLYRSPEVYISIIHFNDIISTSNTDNPPADDDMDKDIGEWDSEM